MVVGVVEEDRYGMDGVDLQTVRPQGKAVFQSYVGKMVGMQPIRTAEGVRDTGTAALSTVSDSETRGRPGWRV